MAHSFNRRDFLKMSSTAAGALALTGPTAPGKTIAADTPIRMGFVGVGDRGSYHLDCALGIEGVTVPALCDIKDSYLYRAKQWVEDYIEGKRER